MHGNTHTTLEGAADVVSVPGDTHWNQWVDTGGSEESADVLNSWLVSAQEHRKTGDGNQLECSHEETTLPHLISSPTGGNGEKTGDHVWWYGHKLSGLVGMAHDFDDGWKEERDGVEWGVDADGDQHVDVDLPVLEGGVKVLDVEVVGERVAILLETALNLDSLNWGKELSGAWVIIDSPVSDSSNGESQETLKDENPSISEISPCTFGVRIGITNLQPA